MKEEQEIFLPPNMADSVGDLDVKAMSHDAIFSCDLERKSTLERCKVG